MDGQRIKHFGDRLAGWLFPSFCVLPDDDPQKRGTRIVLRRRALASAIALAVVILFSKYVNYLIFWVIQGLGLSEKTVYFLFSQSAVLQGLQFVFSLVSFTVPFLLAALICRKQVYRLIPFGKPATGMAVPLLFIGVGFCAFANVAVSMGGDLIDSIFRQMGDEVGYVVDDIPMPRGILGFILTVIVTSVTPAFVEEFAFRGILFGLLEDFGEGFAIVATSVVFGAMHGNFSQIPFAFLVGIVLGFVRVKSQSIWLCFVIHGINNFVSVLASYGGLPNGVENVIYTVYICLALLAGIVGILLLDQRNAADRAFYHLNKGEPSLSEAQKYVGYFTDPLMIGFLVFCIYESCQYFT